MKVTNQSWCLWSLQYNRSWVWSVIYDYWTGRHWRWLSIMQLWNSRCDSALCNRTLPFDIQLFSLRQREKADQTHVLSSELSKLLTTCHDTHNEPFQHCRRFILCIFVFSNSSSKIFPHQCPPTNTHTCNLLHRNYCFTASSSHLHVIKIQSTGILITLVSWWVCLIFQFLALNSSSRETNQATSNTNFGYHP